MSFALLILLNIFIAGFVYLALSLKLSRQTEEGISRRLKSDFAAILDEFNQTADANITLLEERIKSLNKLISHLDEKPEVIKGFQDNFNTRDARHSRRESEYSEIIDKKQEGPKKDLLKIRQNNKVNESKFSSLHTQARDLEQAKLDKGPAIENQKQASKNDSQQNSLSLDNPNGKNNHSILSILNEAYQETRTFLLDKFNVQKNEKKNKKAAIQGQKVEQKDAVKERTGLLDLKEKDNNVEEFFQGLIGKPYTNEILSDEEMKIDSNFKESKNENNDNKAIKDYFLTEPQAPTTDQVDNKNIGQIIIREDMPQLDFSDKGGEITKKVKAESREEDKIDYESVDILNDQSAVLPSDFWKKTKDQRFQYIAGLVKKGFPVRDLSALTHMSLGEIEMIASLNR